MTTLLAFDASTQNLVVALKKGEKIYSFNQLVPQQHARLILPTIHALLEQAQASLADCEAIAFGRGPGSFIGVRIATATAQGLGYALNKPLIPLSSLQITAQSVYQRAQSEKIIVSRNAYKGEFYWGMFELKNGVMKTEQELLSAPGLLAAPTEISLYQDEPIQVEAMLQLAAHYFKAGIIANPLAVKPVYLRNEVTG